MPDPAAQPISNAILYAPDGTVILDLTQTTPTYAGKVAGAVVNPASGTVAGAWTVNGLLTAGAHIATSSGGTAPAAFSPGASGVASVVSATNNVTLICTAVGTQSADGAINGVSIGTTWAAGMVVPLKANDTITWTGTVAPTFVSMPA